MRIFFVNPPAIDGEKYIREGRCIQSVDSWAAIWPPLTLAILASIAKKHGEVRMIDCNVEELYRRKGNCSRCYSGRNRLGDMCLDRMGTTGVYLSAKQSRNFQYAPYQDRSCGYNFYHTGIPVNLFLFLLGIF